jgi:alkylation response protein AidB-like acyl-CoA dehydrogenase
MDFNLSEERSLLSATTDRFLQSADSAQKIIKGGGENLANDAGFWQEASELGIIEALLPVDAGGLGGDGLDLALIFELLGRHLVNAPFLSTAILGAMPLWLQDTQKFTALLRDVGAGKAKLALAIGEADSRYDIQFAATLATAVDAENYRLSGHKAVVLGAGDADQLVVSAKIAEGNKDIGLFLVDGRAEGLKIRSYQTIDAQLAADIWLENVPAVCISEKASDILSQTAAAGALCLSAEAVGLMDVMKDATIEYVKTRKQFGRSIGSFQVIQHRLVDLLMEIEQTRSATMLAAAHLFSKPDVRDKYSSAAKNLAGRIGKLVAEETIQLHGGIAMCWETDIAHYAKRLTMIDHYLGDSDYHLKQMMRLSA